MADIKRYDEEQLEAINAEGGHYLLLAPPGCGKTDILSQRVVNAHNNGVAYSDMLCLTFTNRASRGMKSRVEQYINDDASEIFVGNVHKFCSTMLFSQGLVLENMSVVDEDDMADILITFNPDLFLNKKGLVDKNEVNTVDNICTYILQRQLRHSQDVFFLPSELYEEMYQVALSADFDAGRIPTEYIHLKYALLLKEYKRQRQMIGFSEILVYAYDALLKDSTHNLKRYSWIQVDEVQDLNPLQLAIIDALLDASGKYTVMYLGDEQQAIFSFLGAKLSQLDCLRKRCEGHVMTLSKNYRSPKYLLDVFNTFAESELHVSSELLPQSSHDEPHDKNCLICTGNTTTVDEETRVLRMIEYYLSLSDSERLAVLVPTNEAADRVSRKLLGNGIAHFKISGTDMFRTTSYKTLSSFFCVLVSEFNFSAWSRLIYGVGAIGTAARARDFVAKMRQLMLTPMDLFSDKTYLEAFCDEYAKGEMVFFDTETTGLNVLNDDIVQIAAFKVRNGKRIEGSDFNIILETDKEIPAFLGDIENPLVSEYANSKHYSRAEGLQMFLDYIGGLPLLGHNVNFDHTILQYNVMRILNKEISYRCYDSLKLIKCVEPELKRYKLAYLLEMLHLEGANSHLADEDIAATKAVVDYCYSKAQEMLPFQREFLNHKGVQAIVEKLSVVKGMLSSFEQLLYKPVSDTKIHIAAAIDLMYKSMVENKMIGSLGDKFDIFLRYAETEWTNKNDDILFNQILEHVNDMTSSISEGDLVNSTELISDRVFIMTVYKGKGLEFDNVVILGANDGTYPFFTVNKVLALPDRYTPKQVEQAKMERMEDARKFYVALSRAKKRICVSYSSVNSYGCQTRITPFMGSIRRYFR